VAREERIGVEEREVGERQRVRNKFRGTTGMALGAGQDIGSNIFCVWVSACERLGSRASAAFAVFDACL